MSSYDTTLSALGACLAAGVPTLLWGPPGDGKTSAVRATADALGLHTEVVLASLRDPSDFAGLPPDLTTGTVRLAPPSWAQRLVDAGARGIRPLLFLDEVSCAGPATQAALLRVCADRVVGEADASTVLPADESSFTVEVLRVAGLAAQAQDRGEFAEALRLLSTFTRPLDDPWVRDLGRLLSYGDELTPAQWGRWICSAALRWCQGTGRGLGLGVHYASVALRALGAPDDMVRANAPARSGYD